MRICFSFALQMRRGKPGRFAEIIESFSFFLDFCRRLLYTEFIGRVPETKSLFTRTAGETEVIFK